MRHPSLEDLASFAGGEVSWLRKHLVSRHLSRCPGCEAKVLEFQYDKASLWDAKPDISDFEWMELEEQIRANVLVGLAAGAVVRPEPVHDVRLGWRGAWAVGAVCILVVSGWLMRDPRQMGSTILQALKGNSGNPAILATEGDAVGWTSNGNRILLVKPENSSAVLTVSGASAVQSSYVDEESNQITITQVANNVGLD
jgi:hypothetical protein